MLPKSAFIVFLAIIFVNKVISQNNLQLVVNGKSNYSIVVSNTPTAIETQAANELQKYINQISECKIPIVSESANAGEYQIIVGRTKVNANDTAGLGDDGILIKAANNKLILSGGQRKGVLYSVYTFLEDYLNCKRYSLTDIQIPHTASITIPASIRVKQIPTFDYRMTHYLEVSNKDYCDWNKLNYFMEDWGLWVHSFKTLLPPDQYFASHPEYFALVNGKRVPDQPDLSNPDVLKIVTENLRNLIAKNPTAKYWSVSQNDNKNYCQCNLCRKLDEAQGSHEGSLLTFVNAVAKQFPDKIITTLAYQYSETPPKTIKPSSNVMIMLCAANLMNRRVPIATNALNPNFNRNFERWSQLTSNLFLWNYIAQFGNGLAPFPNLQPLQPDIQYFASKNVKYVFEQGIGYIPGEFSEMKCYLVSKLMWDKSINFNATMQEFLKGYYGDAGAKYLTQYINLLNKNAASGNTVLWAGATAKDAANSYLSLNDINDYKAIFQKAFNETDPNSDYYKHLTKEYLSVLYAELEVRKTNLTSGKRSDFNKQSYLVLLNEYHDKMKSLNIVYMNEGRKKVDDYYKQYMSLVGLD